MVAYGTPGGSQGVHEVETVGLQDLVELSVKRLNLFLVQVIFPVSYLTWKENLK